MGLNVLVIFADPRDLGRLRLGQEHRAIKKLGDEAPGDIHVELQQASQIEDLRSLICERTYDVIHFSGHGDPVGIYLCENGQAGSRLLLAEHLVELVGFASRPPRLMLFLSCFARTQLETLVRAAPFVITALGQVPDEECITFSARFYESFFRTGSVDTSFRFAVLALKTDGLDASHFELMRRAKVLKPSGDFVESHPGLDGDSILVNLDSVREKLDSLAISRGELERSLEKRLRFHDLLFACPQQAVFLPFGSTVFGEFQWDDARDAIYCTKLMVISKDTPSDQVGLWASLLVRYNDLRSSEYRLPKWNRGPAPWNVLARGLALLRIVLARFEAASPIIVSLGFGHILPHLDVAREQCQMAAERLEIEDFGHVQASLESALTSLHEVVNGLQPPAVLA